MVYQTDNQTDNQPAETGNTTYTPAVPTQNTTVKQIDWDAELDKWKKRMCYMDAYFKDASERHGWKNYIKFLWGKVSQAVGISMPIIVVNEVFSYIKTQVASLYAKDPYIAVNPRRSSDTQSAIIKEQVINYRWKKLGLKRQVKKAIQEAKLIGHSWIKVGYEADIRKIDSPQEGELNEKVVGENIWATHVPYKNIYYDPDAKDVPYDCRWIEHHYLKPVSYLESKYNIKGVTATHKPDPTSDEEKLKAKLPNDDLLTTLVHEIWDKDSGHKLVYCDGHDGWLEKIPPVEDYCIGGLRCKGFVFKMLKFNDFPSPDGRDNFPMADVEAWIDQFLTKIKIRSAEVDVMKRAEPQLGIKKGTMSDTEKEKYIKGIAGSLLEFESNPAECMAAIPKPMISTDTYAVENKNDMDKDRISGSAGFDEGGKTTTASRTVGELDQMSAGINNRKQEQIDIVEEFCEEIAQTLIDLEKSHTDLEQTVRIMGEVPMEWLKQLQELGKFDGKSISYTKEDIQGDEDLDIEAGSTLPMNKENRIKTCINMMKFGQAIGLSPETRAGIALGKILMHDMNLVAVEKAYDDDMEEMKNKKPDPSKVLKMLKDKQSLEKGNVDIGLKTQRTTSVNLANLNKAMDNARKMNSKDIDNKQPQATQQATNAL